LLNIVKSFRRQALLIAARVLVLGAMIALPGTSSAQMFQCPAGSVSVSGGGGMMCQCPDGSFASIYGCEQHQQQQQSMCPSGQEPCPAFNLCCYAGNYCSRYGCIPHNSVECGGWHCVPGQQCSRMHGRCLPVGQVDCGTYHCSPGNKCGSGNSCLPEDAADCGPGRGYCTGGNKCSRDGKRCLTQDAIDCGSYSCNAGAKCGSGNKCLASSDVDCGKGKSCPQGNVCVKGGAECLTPLELATRVADEKRRKKEAADAAEADRKAKIQQAKEAKEREVAEAKRKKEEAAAKAAADKASAEKAKAEKKAAEEAAARKKKEEAEARALAEKAEAQKKKEAADAKAAADKAEAKKKKDEADAKAAADKAATEKAKADAAKAAADKKASAELGAKIEKNPADAAQAMTLAMFGDKVKDASLKPLISATETTLSSLLARAMPKTMSAAMRKDAAKDLAELWTKDLTEKGLVNYAGGAARGMVVDKVVGVVADKMGDLSASVAAKYTKNTFAIDFARYSGQLAIEDAYAAKAGGVPGVLAKNGMMIAESTGGLIKDNIGLAKSIKAYEVQVNELVARAQNEPDKQKRDKLLETSIKAISSLNEVKSAHPIIETLSNMPITSTTEELRNWAPP
jgi:hypothetical protein